MTMKKSYWVVFGLLVIILVGAVQVTFAQERINRVHHFGGDALFCTVNGGCQLLNSKGVVLWTITQAEIDAAMTQACETNSPAVEVASSAGTYGEAVLYAGCENGVKSLTLTGFDEHGKPNAMPFGANYQPVSAPQNPVAPRSTPIVVVPLVKPVIPSIPPPKPTECPIGWVYIGHCVPVFGG